QILATLAQTHAVRAMDSQRTSAILRSVVYKNPDYLNVIAVDLHGEIVASGRPVEPTNLADRSHFRQALSEKRFVVGEYVVKRTTPRQPTIAFTYPVLNQQEEVIGVLAATLDLDDFAKFFNVTALPLDSFVAVTDRNGTRLFYYPPREGTHPIGRPIVGKVWEAVKNAQEPGITIDHGSDGMRRIMAFQPVRLDGEEAPYIYMWAGIPEAVVLQPANLILARNLILGALAAALALTITWLVGGKTLLAPINRLLAVTQAFASGQLSSRSNIRSAPGELATLAAAFDRMAEALIEGQERLRTIADFTYDWEYWVGPDRRLVWMSPSCERFTGYAAAEFLENHDLIERIVHPEDIAHFQKHIIQEGTGDRGEHVDFRIVHKSGHTVWMNHHCLPIRRPDGTLLGRRVSNRDITDRKRMDQQLQESESKFRSLVEGAPEGIYVQDDACRFVYVNTAALHLFGAQSPDQLVGMPILDRFHPDAHEDICARIRMLHIEKRKVPRRERVCLRMDGAPVPVEISAVPIVFDGQNWSLVFVQDITERKQTQARLEQAQKMEAIGALAGGIAHDFNNLLFPIMGLSELLLEDLPAGSPERENVAEIHAAGQRAGDLVNQILSFSRQAEHKKVPIRFQQVLKEVIRLTRATIPSNIAMHDDLQLDCGPILADPTNLHQVAMNLITNAYHAVEQSSGSITITFRQIQMPQADAAHTTPAPGAYALLTVADTGHGIPASVMPRIYDPYFTTKAQGKGTGLGLAVVYGIVQEHGGHIRVRSEVGQGTVFDIYLPLLQRDEGAGTMAKAVVHPTGSERLLLVDDEEAIVRMEKQMLERLGYEVTTRTSSVDALEAFKAKPSAYDLVITDMAMPNMTGDELSRRLIAVRADIPVIICTGFSEKMSAAKAHQIGIKGFLMKPLVRGDLANMVRKVLDAAQNERAD
ncbi:MAG: PAS domain S-box protein, partial [Desulfatitalea sp.]|nr:PAS domain S-box protein [Desulfatitalea sp.]